jgi:hypothetical protein
MLKSEKYFIEMQPNYRVEIEASVRLGGMIERLAPSCRCRRSRQPAWDCRGDEDRPDDWDMILLLRRPNYAALDQEAKVAAGYA